MRFRHGLVVGKFSPLHVGHEWLIDNAIDACEQVTILSYSRPEFPNCDRATRDSWLRRRFPKTAVLVLDEPALTAACIAQHIGAAPSIPNNDASDAEQRTFVGWVCDRILGHGIDAVFTSETYGDGFASDLDAYLRRCGRSIGPIRHVCVDLARQRFSISGTKVRSDPHVHRDLLSPFVYASFVKRVCVLGGESSGKTTLAQALAQRLATAWVPEYGRELWERNGGRLSLEDLRRIAIVQVERETELAQRASHWLVCDTSPLTTLFYGLQMFGVVDPVLQNAAERHYDRVLVCAPDFCFVQDGTRRDSDFRASGHRWYVHELTRRAAPWVLIRGGVEARVEAAVAAIGWFPNDLARS